MISRTLYLPVMIAAAVAVACSVVTLLALSEKAQAAFPGKNGKIAFSGMVTEEGYTDQIFAIKPDGTGEKQLTDTSARSFNVTPSYSPDGTKIAFTRSTAVPDCSGCYKPSELATVRPDGTGLKVITNTPGTDEASAPDWSPDGRRLVFQHYLNATEFNRIETIRADGTGLRTVFAPRNLRARDPVFSPDGTKIAFDYELGRDIWKINLDGTGLTNVTNTPERWERSPDWGPKPTATTTR